MHLEAPRSTQMKTEFIDVSEIQKNLVVDINRYPEKKARYAKVSDDEWTVGQKHCFVMEFRG